MSDSKSFYRSSHATHPLTLFCQKLDSRCSAVLYQLHLSNLARLDMPINTKPTGLSAGGFSMPLVLAILELQRLQIFSEVGAEVVALRKPSLSPVSWRLP